MPRPNKLNEPTSTFNLIIQNRILERLRQSAHEQTAEIGKHVSVSDIVRPLIEEWYERTVNENKMQA